MNITLQQDQLLFKDHYQWPQLPEQDPRISGDLSETLFEPEDGNQVLYFINKLLAVWKFDEMKYARKIEKMIKVGLPENIGTQINAKAWIKDHWGNY